MSAETEKPTVLHVNPRKSGGAVDSVSSSTETMIKGSSRSFSPFSEITIGDALIVSTDVLESCENKTITSTTPTQKKIQRAERFGVPLQLSEEEKRSSRAQRFGTKADGHGVIDVQKNPEEEKRKARAERFGLPASSTAIGEEVKKKARLARFSSVPMLDSAEEEEKRMSRAKRFSNVKFEIRS